jgi:hypothetical protein
MSTKTNKTTPWGPPDYGYKSREELAKEARREAGENTDSDSDSADEAVSGRWELICACNTTDIRELQEENKELKIRLSKLEKTVCVLELIRKQSEKDRLEEMMKYGFKETTNPVVPMGEGSNVHGNVYYGDTEKIKEIPGWKYTQHILHLLDTIVTNQHRAGTKSQILL